LGRARLQSLLKNSTLSLLSGGAAVHRCDTRLLSNTGLSR
jgi:hypothetical protein